MAGNIKVTDSAVYGNGALQATVAQLIQNVPQATQGYADFIWDAPASDTALVLPAGITALGVAWFWNLDLTADGSHYCDIGPDVAGSIAPMVRVISGVAGAAASRSGMVPLTPGITLRTLGNIVTVKLQVIIFNA